MRLLGKMRTPQPLGDKKKVMKSKKKKVPNLNITKKIQNNKQT